MRVTSEPELLTTGKAARLCAVKPDTILKWIKRGRLEAVRTAGGHYRIHRCDIEPLVRGLRMGDMTSPPPPDCNPQPMRCWEYLSPDGEVREECRKCVVYRVRAAWCFQIAGLSQDIGHAKHFCRTSCRDCAYYRRVRGLASHVLVVTSDKAFQYRLSAGEPKQLALQFAQNAYEASAAIQSFRPGFVIVDRELNGADENELIQCLASDARIPGLRIILAVAPGIGKRGLTGPNQDRVVAVLEKPFESNRVAAVIDSLPVELLNKA